ncbi:SDR family NAD(P)-dependent oxidoreductase [Pseudonocardia sp. HH130630-07]|uniref:SDR family NAD(P)-dependent oxidoreductase n=1 Tax=Pseudonocardia sp. HH130630-07 TaxID=1690815 RepID=UPI000814FE6A|nr:SDR family oxidoreductase [Pseudonocardia sp. HH130630-07]ANY06744.1 3-oxoacyl-ACP reductase [Pseudonocardia sp. HH130630-07]
MRNVVVTGAGTGIGRATARRLHGGGAHVTLIGRRPGPLHDLAGELGDRAVAVPVDLTDPEAVGRAVLPDVVDVLVNNAGGNTDLSGGGPGDDLAGVARSWRANLDANLLSAVLATTAVRDRLRPGGTVVNVGSIAADKGAGSYGAAKAALACWTVDLAGQLGPADVTVNTLAPGYVAGTEFFGDHLDDDRRAALVAAAATRRASLPDDVAAAAEFLASPGARQITGQVLAVNGGEHRRR